MDWDEFVSDTLKDYLKYDHGEQHFKNNQFPHFFQTDFGSIEPRIDTFSVKVKFHTKDEDHHCEFREYFSSNVGRSLLERKAQPWYEKLFTSIINRLKNDYMKQFLKDAALLKSKHFRVMGFGYFKLGEFKLHVGYFKSRGPKPNEMRKLILLNGDETLGFDSYEEFFSKLPLEMFMKLDQESRDGILS